MDRRAWWATVHGVTRVRHDFAIKIKQTNKQNIYKVYFQYTFKMYIFESPMLFLNKIDNNYPLAKYTSRQTPHPGTLDLIPQLFRNHLSIFINDSGIVLLYDLPWYVSFFNLALIIGLILSKF